MKKEKIKVHEHSNEDSFYDDTRSNEEGLETKKSNENWRVHKRDSDSWWGNE